MKDLIAYLATSLVDKTEMVQVNEVEKEGVTVIELSVDKEEIGKIIGKGGRTAKAMRVLLGSASARLGKRVILEIVE